MAVVDISASSCLRTLAPVVCSKFYFDPSSNFGGRPVFSRSKNLNLSLGLIPFNVPAVANKINTLPVRCNASEVSVADEEGPSPSISPPSMDNKNWVPVVPLSALPKGERRLIRQDGDNILLLWYKNEVVAIENKSPAEGAYSEGLINAKLTQDGCIMCPMGTSAVLQGLQSLLSGIVQVDAFQLQYEACKDVSQRDTLQSLSADCCEQRCTNDDQSTNFSILQWNRESGETNHFNYKISKSGGPNTELSNHEKENGDSVIGKTFNVGLTATDNMLVENGSVTRLCHPVPCSSSQIMDFGVFISELNALLLQQRNQLLYLTWRGIPALKNLESLPAHAEFHFFIRSLFHPTTSPQFIAEDAIFQRNLWIGAIVTSRIHFDALDNVHSCISGTKLFHLYPPSALTYLYPNPWKEGALNNFSSMESIFLANHVQHAKFFQNVKCWRAEVKAGEAIFIPAGWWHEVFTFQETVSANIWFKPNPVARFRPSLMHLKSENYYKFMLQRKESS